MSLLGNVKATEKMRAVGDMCLMAFYFLFQVGKYTQHKKNANWHTTQPGSFMPRISHSGTKNCASSRMTEVLNNCPMPTQQ
jgi:hypothetical protein